MSEGMNVLDNTVLAQFLGADGIDELRSKVIDMIVDEIHSQLKSSSYYIISPDDIANDIYNNIIDDLVQEIKEEYSDRVKEVVQKKLEGLGI